MNYTLKFNFRFENFIHTTNFVVTFLLVSLKGLFFNLLLTIVNINVKSFLKENLIKSLFIKIIN